MKILADENILKVTVSELASMGHDVLDLRGGPQQGCFDDEVWAIAQAQHRLLITTDKGFCEHRDEQHFGLLVVRLRQPNEQAIHVRIMSALGSFDQDGWTGLMVVMRDAVQSIHRAR